MNNYTTLNEKILDAEVDFIKKITAELGKVDTHFLADMINGVLSNNSVILSDIVRTTGNLNIKKGVERLERHLDNFTLIEEKLDKNYANIVKTLINARHLYFVDGGDIIKDPNTKFENMGYVLDGSKKHELARGYKIYEIDSIDNNNQPISLVSDLSTNDKKITDSNKELSENLEWKKRLEIVSKIYGFGTFICDRGFDGAIMMQNMLELGCDFIIRASKLDRYVYKNGEKIKIKEIAKNLKGYYKFTTTIKGKTNHLKVSSVPVRIKSTEAKELNNHLLTLVIVKGYDDTDAYMALLTSRKVNTKDAVIQVVRDYILRWKIEENFKFKKQQFHLEEIKVRKYKRIQAMNKLLSMILIYTNIINLSAVGKTIRKIKNQIREDIKIWLYRVATGIAKIINITTKKIIEKLYPRREPRRRDLFTVMNVSFRMV